MSLWWDTVPHLAVRDEPAGEIMRHRQSVMRHAAWLAVPVAALSLALGAGAASASTLGPRVASHGASTPAAAASGVTWHKIVAINSWHSAESHDLSGDPSWGVKSGVVYLSGSVFRSGGSSRLFAVLPTQARPSHTLRITVCTYDCVHNGVTGTLVVYPSGKMYADGGHAARFTSLAGLSYPARSTAQKKLTLIHGWKSSQSSRNSGDPSYTVRGGVVYLSGALHLPSGSNAEFAVLPKAARPANLEYIIVDTNGGTFGTLQIQPTGASFAYSGSATGFTSLAGVSYPVATATRHKLTLLNGWHSQSGFHTGDPSYDVSGGVVYLSGSLATSDTMDTFFALLPASARPKHELFIKVYANDSTVGMLQIEPDGDMFVGYGPVLGTEAAFTSLATISFPLRS